MGLSLEVIKENGGGCDKHRELSELYTTWGTSKLLQHTDLLFDMQKNRHFFPIQVQLCPTEVCDSDCPFCAVGYRPYKSSMPWSMIEKCLLDFKSLGAKSVEITGGGNPLLYKCKDTGKTINDIIRLAASLGLDIGIITNSEKLTRLDKSLYEKINWLRVSLIKLDEGKNPEDYDFNDFPYSKLGFSYIIYDEGKGCRTERDYKATDNSTIEKIARLVELHPGIKFVRIAGNSLITGYNDESSKKFKGVIDAVDKYSKFFIKDIGLNDFPYDHGCYVGMIRPYIAASPKGDGKYYAYICNSHVLFSNQTYDTDFAFCEIQDIIESYGKLNDHYKEHGYPYSVKGNCGKGWQKTCKLCFYQPNNELLHAVVTEIPDKNFP